jgi:hypothetical protein
MCGHNSPVASPRSKRWVVMGLEVEGIGVGEGS